MKKSKFVGLNLQPIATLTTEQQAKIKGGYGSNPSTCSLTGIRYPSFAICTQNCSTGGGGCPGGAHTCPPGTALGGSTPGICSHW